MSPVKAPDGSAWQSWPPIATLRAARTARRSVDDQRRRRADHQVGLAGQAPAPCHDLAELGGRGLAARSSSNCPRPAGGASMRPFVHPVLTERLAEPPEAAPEAGFGAGRTRVAMLRHRPLYSAPIGPGIGRSSRQHERFHASRYSQSLRQLARPRRHGRRPRPDRHQLRDLGHRRHFPRLRPRRPWPRSAAPKSASSSSASSTTTGCSSSAARSAARSRPTRRARSASTASCSAR